MVDSVLIAQGTNDLQVAVSEAAAPVRARPDATLLLVPDMTHTLKPAWSDAARSSPTSTPA